MFRSIVSVHQNKRKIHPQLFGVFVYEVNAMQAPSWQQILEAPVRTKGSYPVKFHSVFRGSVAPFWVASPFQDEYSPSFFEMHPFVLRAHTFEKNETHETNERWIDSCFGGRYVRL